MSHRRCHQRRAEIHGPVPQCSRPIEEENPRASPGRRGLQAKTEQQGNNNRISSGAMALLCPSDRGHREKSHPPGHGGLYETDNRDSQKGEESSTRENSPFDEDDSMHSDNG